MFDHSFKGSNAVFEYYNYYDPLTGRIWNLFGYCLLLFGNFSYLLTVPGISVQYWSGHPELIYFMTKSESLSSR